MNPNDFSTQDILQFAKQDAAQKGQALQTEYTFTDNALGFYHAVSWSEDKWIFLVFFLHFLLLCLVLATRKAEVELQGMVFLLLVSLTAGASALNALAHKQYRLFSTQDYFDRRGTFTSVIWTGPLILILLLQLICMVRLTADLAVQAGRLKVRDNIRKRSQQTGEVVGKDGKGKGKGKVGGNKKKGKVKEMNTKEE